MEFLKTTNENIKAALLNIGLTYMTELINGEMHYSFLVNKENIETLKSSCYEHEDFFVDNKLTF